MPKKLSKKQFLKKVLAKRNLIPIWKKAKKVPLEDIRKMWKILNEFMKEDIPLPSNIEIRTINLNHKLPSLEEKDVTKLGFNIDKSIRVTTTSYVAISQREKLRMLHGKLMLPEGKLVKHFVLIDTSVAKGESEWSKQFEKVFHLTRTSALKKAIWNIVVQAHELAWSGFRPISYKGKIEGLTEKQASQLSFALAYLFVSKFLGKIEYPSHTLLTIENYPIIDKMFPE